MSNYIPVTIETDPTDLAGEAFDYLQGQVPGWLPAPGNLEAWLVEALAQIAGELRTLTGLVPDQIFAYFGSSILGLQPYPALQATGLTTWTARDDAGYTIDAGTVIALTPPAQTTAWAFAVVDRFTIPNGQTTASGVMVRALQAGAGASGITGTVQVIDTLDFITGVTLDGPTTGGQDAETSAAYLSRLSALLTLLAPRPILPGDFAVMAQRMVEGVARAVAIDLLNPDTGDTNCPRCVTVALVDSTGEPVSPAIHQQVQDLLESEREVNFLVFTIDPTYTTIDVTCSVMAFAGFDPNEVAGRVQAALISYLSPGTWGVPSGRGDPTAQGWINTTAIRYLELGTVINGVDGVDYITALTFGTHGGALGNADVVLGGHAPLPRPGTITATATVEA